MIHKNFVAKLQIDFNKEPPICHPNDHKEKLIHLSRKHKETRKGHKKHKGYENELEKRKGKK